MRQAISDAMALAWCCTLFGAGCGPTINVFNIANGGSAVATGGPPTVVPTTTAAAPPPSSASAPEVAEASPSADAPLAEPPNPGPPSSSPQLEGSLSPPGEVAQTVEEPSVSPNTKNGFGNFAEYVIAVPGLLAAYTGAAMLTIADARGGQSHDLVSPGWIAAGGGTIATFSGATLAAGPGSEGTRAPVLFPLFMTTAIAFAVELYGSFGALAYAAIGEAAGSNHHEVVGPSWAILAIDVPGLLAIAVGTGLLNGFRKEEISANRPHLYLGRGPGQAGVSVGASW